MPDYKIAILVEAKDQASGALGKIGGALGGLGKVAALGLGGAAVGLAGIGAGLVKLAKDAEPLEGITKAFDGITESMEGGSERMLEALQKGSLGMVRQTDLMATFNEASQLVSRDFAEQLPDAMKYLAKISASTGEDMGFMLDSMVKGVGRLSPAILDNLKIQVDSAEAYRVHAESIGKNVDELTKQEQQTAMMNQVLEKLAENTAAMPDIMDNAATKSAQMDAKMADLKDTIGLKLLPIWTTFQEKALELADKYLPVVIAFFEDTVVPVLENVVVPIIEKLANWIGVFLPVYFALMEAAWNAVLKPALGALIAIIENPIIPLLEQVFAWLGDHLPEAMAFLKRAWDNVLKPALTAIWNFIKDPLIPIISKLVTWFKDTLTDAWGILKGVWDTVLRPMFSAVVAFIEDPIVPILTTLYNWFATTIPEAFGILKGAWDFLKENVFDKIVAFIEDTLIPAFTSIKDAIIGAFTGVDAVIRGAFNTIIGIVEGAINNFIRGMNSLIDRLNSLPGVSIKHIGEITIPRLALGGLVNAAEALALVHRGELVMPLGSPSTIRLLAAAMREAGAGGRSGVTIQIINNFGRDSIRQRTDIMDLANAITHNLQLRGGETRAF